MLHESCTKLFLIIWIQNNFLINLDDDDDVVTIPTQAAAGAIRITVRQGDITEADTCSIVNSSDSSMNLTAGTNLSYRANYMYEDKIACII